MSRLSWRSRRPCRQRAVSPERRHRRRWRRVTGRARGPAGLASVPGAGTGPSAPAGCLAPAEPAWRACLQPGARRVGHGGRRAGARRGVSHAARSTAAAWPRALSGHRKRPSCRPAPLPGPGPARRTATRLPRPPKPLDDRWSFAAGIQSGADDAALTTRVPAKKVLMKRVLMKAVLTKTGLALSRACARRWPPRGAPGPLTVPGAAARVRGRAGPPQAGAAGTAPPKGTPKPAAVPGTGGGGAGHGALRLDRDPVPAFAGVGRQHRAGARPSGHEPLSLPEKLLALEHHPDGQGHQGDGAHHDRDVNEQQLTGGNATNQHPDGDRDQRGAEPDHLSSPRVRPRRKSCLPRG